MSVVLPAFNAERTIGPCVAALREELSPLVVALELVVVDDGSTDETAATVARLAEKSADLRLLRSERNLGKGMAVYLGVLAARFPKVCFTDADLAFAPRSYARVVERVLSGHALAIASRRLPQSEILLQTQLLGYAARRHVVGLTFNWLVRKGLGLPFSDTQCGLKAFDREVGLMLCERLRTTRFLFDVELLLAAEHAKVPVEEVPVCVRYHDSKSSIRLFADSGRTILELIGIWRRDRAGAYAVPNPAMARERLRGWASERTPAMGSPSEVTSASVQ